MCGKEDDNKEDDGSGKGNGCDDSEEDEDAEGDDNRGGVPSVTVPGLST